MTKLDENIIAFADVLGYGLPKVFGKKGPGAPAIFSPVVHDNGGIKKMNKGHAPSGFRVSPGFFYRHSGVTDQPDLYLFRMRQGKST